MARTWFGSIAAGSTAAPALLLAAARLAARLGLTASGRGRAGGR